MRDESYTKSFARIYDDIMQNVPYDLWFKYLQELLSYYNKKPARVIDLACGTGNMSLRFADKVDRIVGIDKSVPMLKRAEEKAHNQNLNIEFIRANLQEFRLPSQYSFAFSIFDSLNYILSLEDLKNVFINVYQALDNDGIFIFDMNTIKRLMSIEPGTTMFTGDNYTCFWQDIIDEDNLRWKVRLKIYLDNDQLNYYEELHEETGYPLKKVENLLYEVGFEQVDIFRAYTFNQGSEGDNRVYFSVIKDITALEKNSLFNRAKSKLKWKFSRCGY